MHKKRKKNARVLSLSLLSAQSARAMMRQERAAGSGRGESLKKKQKRLCAREENNDDDDDAGAFLKKLEREIE